MKNWYKQFKEIDSIKHMERIEEVVFEQGIEIDEQNNEQNHIIAVEYIEEEGVMFETYFDKGCSCCPVERGTHYINIEHFDTLKWGI